MTSAVGGYWLQLRSEEYEAVRFALTAACQNIGVVGKLEIWKIDNPDLIQKYEQASTDMLKINSFLSIDSLPAGNSIKSICSKGYNMGSSPNAGALFTTGTVLLSNKSAAFTGELQFLMFEVAVGRSFAFDGSLAAAFIPPGYDSLYIPDQPLDKSRDGKFSLHKYQNAPNFDKRDSTKYAHKYFIKNGSQILPKYVLKFRLSRVRDSRVLDPNNSIDLRYIDPVTLDASSSESSSSTADRNLVPIEKVFAQVITDIKYLDSDAATLHRHRWANHQLGQIEDKVREINLNYADMDDAIETITQQSKKRLQQLIRDKLELCLSMEIEVHRESEYWRWLQTTVVNELQRYQQAMTDAAGADRIGLMYDFLKLWRQFQQEREKMAHGLPSELQALASVQGDVKIEGTVNVFADPFHQLANQLSAVTVTASIGLESDSKGAVAQPIDYPDIPPEDKAFVVDFMTSLRHVAKSDPNGDVNTDNQETSIASTALLKAVAQEMASIEALLLQPKQPATPQTAKAATVKSNSAAGRLSLLQMIMNVALTQLSGRHQKPLTLAAVLAVLQTEAAQARQLREAKNQAEADLAAEGKQTKTEEESHEDDQRSVHSKSGTASNNSTTQGQRSSPKSKSGAAEAANVSKSKAKANSEQIQRPSMLQVNGPPSPLVEETDAHSVSSHHSQVTSLSQQQHPPRPTAEENARIHMTLIQLQQFADQFTIHRLSTQAAKKQRQLQIRYASGAASANDSYKDFAKSHIVQADEVQSVYFSLPIFSQPPRVKLIYATYIHRRSLEELLARTMKHRFPTLIVLRSGDYRFGVYLSHAPVPTCSWAGSPSCFLFSLTLDLKIPFHARHSIVKTGSTPGHANSEASALQEPAAMFVQPDKLFVGNGDFTLDASLETGSSELENCYGLGMETQSVEAMCLLAGTPIFTVDELEVWSLQSN